MQAPHACNVTCALPKASHTSETKQIPENGACEGWARIQGHQESGHVSRLYKHVRDARSKEAPLESQLVGKLATENLKCSSAHMTNSTKSSEDINSAPAK